MARSIGPEAGNQLEDARRCGEGTRTVRDWLSRIDKDSKEARNKRIFDMWMACWTDAEIGKEVGLTERQIGTLTEEMADLPKLQKPDQSAAEHATDFAE